MAKPKKNINSQKSPILKKQNNKKQELSVLKNNIDNEKQELLKKIQELENKNKDWKNKYDILEKQHNEIKQDYNQNYNYADKIILKTCTLLFHKSGKLCNLDVRELVEEIGLNRVKEAVEILEMNPNEKRKYFRS